MAQSHAVGRDAELLAGRYELRAELGRGGMGAVHCAYDHVTGTEVALKTLEMTDRVATSLFEREYRVLASLQHPRVIRVHDYGVLDGDRRYYTMEVLPGKDLMQLAPLPWQKACGHLRDVATCLALLHARGLLHRDVSPRNVRLDRGGRAKLIDFGALGEFGLQETAVGTPTCMAPEVVRGQPLDARTDLFSLGAVAYWVLTGKLAYSPGRLHEVETALRTKPLPPSHHDPGIPKALDQLVMSMLAQDPMERPSSAAEVIERLSAIASMEEEPLAALARSHLMSSKLVGRQPERAQVRKRLLRAVRGRGGSVSLQGARGSGRSRLLTELAVEGRLARLATMRVDALACQGESGAVRGLAAALLEAAPLEARSTLPAHLGVLSQVDPGLAAHAAVRASAGVEEPSSPADRRAQLQNALASWILDVAKLRPLLVLVDDAHELDTTSAGCLVLLAHESRRHSLMLVTTRRDDVEPPAAIVQLGKLSARVPLAPLAEQDVDALLASAFGDVPYRIRLSGWLHGVGQGNPSHTFLLLNELIQRQIIRYEGGAWALPSELSEVDLPQSMLGILAEQAAQLDPVARSLAQMFALHRGSLSIQVCAKLLPALRPAVVQQTVQQLVDRGVLVSVAGEEYRIAEDAMRRLLLDVLERDHTRVLHRTLGVALREMHAGTVEAVLAGKAEQLSTEDLLIALRIGGYLADCEDFGVGHVVLRNAAIALTIRGDGLVEAVPSLETALRAYRDQGRSTFETAPLLMPLALAGTYVNWQLTQRHGSEAMSLLCEVTGMERAVRWSRWLGRPLALVAAFAVAAVLFHCTVRRRMMPTFRHGFLGLMGIGTALLSSYIIVENRPRAKQVYDQLMPLGWFPKSHPVKLVHSLQRSLYENVEGRYGPSCARAHAVLARLADRDGLAGFPDAARMQLQVGAALLAGQMDAMRTDGQSREVIEVLENVATAVSRQATASVRAAQHAHRGERAKYNAYQGQLDLLAAQAGTTWREDITGARRLWGTFALCEDVMALKRLHRRFDALVVELPSLRRVHGAIHSAYLAERGMHAEALAKYAATLEEAAQESNTVSLLYAGVYARLLRGVGAATRALEVCVQALERQSPAELQFEVAAIAPRVEIGLALVAMGKLDQARAHALSLLDVPHGDNPFLHGLAHKLVAQVALARRDREEFVQHLAKMAGWFRGTDNAALVSQCHRLAEEGRAAGLLIEERPVDRTETSRPQSTIRRLREDLGRCRDSAERLQLALSAVLRASGAARGYLYLRGPRGIVLAAPREGAAPPAALGSGVESICTAVASAASSDSPVDLAEDDDGDTVLFTPDYETLELEREGSRAGAFFHVLQLSLSDGSSPTWVGAVALLQDDAPLKVLDSELVSEVARIVGSTADSETAYLDEQSA